MSWIRLVLEACVRPPGGTVVHKDLLGVALAQTDASALPQLVLAFQLRLKPVKLGLGSYGGEVATVYARGQFLELVHEDTNGCIHLLKADRRQESRILLLPSVGLRPGPIHVLLE